MSNILITGGCGFVGSHLARFLIEADYNVILTDLAVNEKLIKDIKGKCTIVETDVTNLKQLENVLKKYRIEAVVHYAALLSAAIESNPQLGYEVDFKGLWNVYNAARATEVESIIFSSSVAAYGPNISYEAKEDMYTIPHTLYGISKQFGEMLGLWFYRKYGIQFVAFRYASIIGPGRLNGGASAYSTLIIQKPAQGEPYEVNVREEDVIPIAYIKDVVEVTTVAYEKMKSLKNRIYNVASLSPSPTAGELASNVKKWIPSAKISFKPNPTIIDIIKSWTKNLDTTRVQSELGWKPKFNNLDTLISDFTQTVKEHPKMFYI